MLTSILELTTNVVSKTISVGIKAQQKISGITTDMGTRNVELIERIAQSNPDHEMIEELQEVVNHYGSLPATIVNHMAMEVAIKVLVQKYDVKLKEKEVKKEETISDMLTRIRKHNLCK
jgi:large-conductance mechanosensitive channel